MAGHSKWANIKHRKAAQDAKRGKVFTKLIRELVVAAKAGGPNPEDNPRLRAGVDKALGANMKRDTIDKAIARVLAQVRVRIMTKSPMKAMRRVALPFWSNA